MLAEARALVARTGQTNVTFLEGSIYAVPYPDGAFDIVTCRFAFHHLTDPARAFGEMLRLTAPGGRLVLCDGLASDDPVKAAAFNAMERWRDPSTVAFRSHDDLVGLFLAAGLDWPAERRFQVPYLAHQLIAASFPAGDDRAGLQALFEASVDGDRLGMNAQATPKGVRITFPSLILSAVKPL